MIRFLLKLSLYVLLPLGGAALLISFGYNIALEEADAKVALIKQEMQDAHDKHEKEAGNLVQEFQKRLQFCESARENIVSDLEGCDSAYAQLKQQALFNLNIANERNAYIDMWKRAAESWKANAMELQDVLQQCRSTRGT